jgi:hypothetical protein
MANNSRATAERGLLANNTRNYVNAQEQLRKSRAFITASKEEGTLNSVNTDYYLTVSSTQ